MKSLKRLLFFILAAAIVNFSAPLEAQDYYYAGGNGYNEYRSIPSLGPAIALGAIAIVAIVAVALQNQSGGHNH